MNHTLWLALLLAWSGTHAATPPPVTGTVTACAQAATCRQLIQLRVTPTANPGSLFLAVAALTPDGQPDLTQVGWYTGTAWQAGGLPKAAWSGTLEQPRRVTVVVPGGLCAMARAAGSQAAEVAVLAGWGESPQLNGMTAAELDRAAVSAMPQAAERYRRAAQDYRAAQARLAQYGGSDSAAFVAMRAQGSYRILQHVHCGEPT